MSTDDPIERLRLVMLAATDPVERLRMAMVAATAPEAEQDRLDDAVCHAYRMNRFAEVQAEHEAHSRRTLGKYGHAFGM